MKDDNRASHACSCCKHSHRRCDRALPVCSGCKAKGKKCSYDELPKKPGPKSHHHIEETPMEPLPLPVPIQQKVEFDYPTVDIPEAVDNFFESVCYHTPLFDRSTLQELFEYRKALREHTLDELETIPSKQDRALLFALEAVLYKNTNISGAESHAAEMSRKMMSGHFDTVLLDTKMACAYLLLGIYYKLENNQERYRFYIHNVSLAVTAWKENNQLGDLMIEDDPNCFRMSYLEIWLNSLTIADSRDNMQLYLKIMLYMNSIVERCNELYDFGGAYHPGTQFDEYIQPFLGQIKEDIDNKTNARFPIDLKTLELIISNISKTMLGHDELNVLTLNRRNILLFAEGYKIQLLQKAGHRTSNTIRAVADDIAANSEFASLCMLQSGSGYPLLAAMQVHSDCLAVSQDQKERLDLTNNLKQNVKVLKGMMYVNKRLDKEIGYIVSNITKTTLKEESTKKAYMYDQDHSVFLPTTETNNFQDYFENLDQVMFL